MVGTGGFLRPEEIVKQFNIKENMIIADFGCGAGHFSIPLAKLVGDQGKIYALDVLETALESVRSRAKLQGLFNIETKRCNLELPIGSGLDSNSIDLVLLGNILFQSSKKDDIIKEAYRVLKSKGEIMVIDWKPNQPMGPPANLIVPQDSLKKIINEAGLKFIKEFPVDKYHWGTIFVK